MTWLKLLLGLILLIILFYTIIPDIFLHRLGFGSWKRQFSPGVALTFDDGPDPENTPRLLEILRQRHIPATFFVVAEKAKKYPDLIRQIVADGHQIGLHSLDHRYAWFALPGRTDREWTESLQELEKISGKKITWMRPPWGTFNLMTWLWLKKQGLKAVLWNVEGHDWKADRSPAEIAGAIARKVNEGSIVVMHDSGGESGAPEHTLAAVELLREQIEGELKLPFVPLEFPDWPLSRRLTFRLWEKWEHYYARKHHVERVDATNILRLEKSVYGGPVLYDEDGAILAQKGDVVAEIHLDNVRLQAQGSDMQRTALKAIRQARKSLPDLAKYVAEHPAYDDIKVFMGETLIYRGVRGFGFNVQDLPDTWRSRGIAWLQLRIMRVYHPAGKERQNERLGTQTKLVWISRRGLLAQTKARGAQD